MKDESNESIFNFFSTPFFREFINKSGILLSGGAGTLDNEFVSPMTAGQIGRSFDLEYNYDLHLGYRYRLRQNDWLFWDLDALFGIKSFRKGILTGYGSTYVTCANGDRHLNYYLALSPSANAFLYKGLYAGIGIEPTWYLYRAVYWKRIGERSSSFHYSSHCGEFVCLWRDA